MIKYWKYITWLLILLSCKTSQIQSHIADTPIIESITYLPYSICFYTKNEIFVSSYKLMRSTNNRNWNTIATFAPKNSPDSSSYCFQLAKSSTGYYYKLVSTCSNNIYTNSLTYISSTLK